MALLLVGACRAAPPAKNPLSGTWVLDTARSHYGHGAERRERETMRCSAADERFFRCEIASVRAGGRRLNGSFRAAYDGRAWPASGIPGIDQVMLSRIDDAIVDATFRSAGRPVFGYRSVLSEDRNTLTVVSVDPVTRKVLTSVVVYVRRR